MTLFHHYMTNLNRPNRGLRREFKAQARRLRLILRTTSWGLLLAFALFSFAVLWLAHSVFTPDGKPLDMTGEETMRAEGHL